jgi:hypothetical protein
MRGPLAAARSPSQLSPDLNSGGRTERTLRFVGAGRGWPPLDLGEYRQLASLPRRG